MKIKHKECPIKCRVAVYPCITDQIDAIYKGFTALEEQGFVFPKETQEWLRQIASVKSTYPKREK